MNDTIATQHRQDCEGRHASSCENEMEPMFILQRRTCTYSDVSDLILQVWTELPHKDWFAVDDPGYLTHIFSLESTLVFEACTPDGKLAAVCILVEPETDEENLGQYATIPRSEWHQVKHVDIVATLPDYRGHSLQSRLMAYAENYLRMNNDTKYLMATVHPDNLPSRRSMEKLGYTCVATANMYGGLPRCVYYMKL